VTLVFEIILSSNSIKQRSIVVKLIRVTALWSCDRPGAKNGPLLTLPRAKAIATSTVKPLPEFFSAVVFMLWFHLTSAYSTVCPLPLQPPASRPARGCVPATAIIWGCSTGMFAIDLLLSTSAQSEMAIAIAIVVAAAISTMTVWLSCTPRCRHQG
jgi:hypothetical protein